MSSVHVSAKGIIRRDGDLNWLVLKERDHFTLPGGFVQPGETPEKALRRKFADELGLTARFSATEVCEIPYASPKGGQFLWQVFRIEIEGRLRVSPPAGMETISFVMPAIFRRSRPFAEQRIYQCFEMTGL